MREGLSHADKREIVLASLPHLRTGANGRYSAVIDWLAKNAQIDHILSTVIDNPVNLILDWSAPNGHHGDFRNCEGKAARFGDDVMDAVTNGSPRPSARSRRRRVGSRACARPRLKR